MERDDRAPVASFFAEAIPSAGETALLGGEPAHHARVKRLELGDVIRIVDGKGRIGFGSITSLKRESLSIAIDSIEEVAPPAPIHLRVPIGDRDRMLWLAEMATELGIMSWQAVRFRRSSSVSPRGEGDAFAGKVRARMLSALEQSGGAWLPQVQPDVGFEELSFEPDERPILLDIGGAPLASLPLSDGASPVILFGPEGGLEVSEREQLLSRGWAPARVATNTLRFETAGLTAVAVCRNLQMLQR